MNKIVILIIWLGYSIPAWAQLKAFPEAQGFGAYASGGRGGAVIKVTNLNATGAGSLQAAMNQPGPRIIVFDVSGIITGDISIPHGDVTLAGQTAPGAGITLVGHLYTPYNQDISNIIIRHIRVRPPNPDGQWPSSQHDAIQFSTANRIILDHIDASHGADETIDFWGGAAHITLQYSHLSFPIYDTANGWTHNKGIINHRPCLDNDSCNSGSRTGGYISILNNVFTHARNRTPALSVGPAEVINNITYNGREGFVHHNIVAGEFNIIANQYIEGPSISLLPFWFDPENNVSQVPSDYWLHDNLVEDPGTYTGVVNNPWTDVNFTNAYNFYCCGINANQFNQTTAFDFTIYSGYEAPQIGPSVGLEARLLTAIGAYPHDIVAQQSIQELQSRTGSWRNYRPADLMAGLTPTPALLDSDNDGMPDYWEMLHNLNPNNGNDHTNIMPSGYTAIEAYINELASGFTDVIFSNGFD
ncbi:MAG: pectate lyase precursor [Proteobacteria bacterium]|nr:MAG: pectate lyase precursor [Pseudomonadota bacterium]